MTKAMRCVVEVQHEDGTIDLHSTNFHSTPDTAFFVNYLSPVYIVLKNLDQLKLKDLISYFEIFLKKTSKCLLLGCPYCEPSLGYLLSFGKVKLLFSFLRID